MLNQTYGKAAADDSSALVRLDRTLRELFRATPLHVLVDAVRTALKKRVR